MKTTEEVYNLIMESEVFRLDGTKIDLPQALIDLCEAINAEEETNWHLTNGMEADLSDLVCGAYWSLTEWHAGQYSATYAALCALGSIFSPGMSGPPTEEEYGEYSAYELCGKWFEAQKQLPTIFIFNPTSHKAFNVQLHPGCYFHDVFFTRPAFLDVQVCFKGSLFCVFCVHGDAMS